MLDRTIPMILLMLPEGPTTVNEPIQVAKQLF